MPQIISSELTANKSRKLQRSGRAVLHYLLAGLVVYLLFRTRSGDLNWKRTDIKKEFFPVEGMSSAFKADNASDLAVSNIILHLYDI